MGTPSPHNYAPASCAAHWGLNAIDTLNKPAGQWKYGGGQRLNGLHHLISWTSLTCPPLSSARIFGEVRISTRYIFIPSCFGRAECPRYGAYWSSRSLCSTSIYKLRRDFCPLSLHIASKSDFKIPNPRIVLEHDWAYLLFLGRIAYIFFPSIIYFSVNVALITITGRHTLTFLPLPRCLVWWYPEMQANHFPSIKQKNITCGPKLFA